MSAEGVAKFIGLVAVHFPKPRFDDTDTDEVIWQASLTKLLAQFDDAVLVRGAEEIIRTRDAKKDGAYFPKPNVCVAACERAARLAEHSKVPLLAATKMPSGFSRERHQIALDLLRIELGAQALKEGWHSAFYDFVYRNNRAPSPAECEPLKALVREIDGLVKSLEKGDITAGPDFDVLKVAQLGRNVIRRRDKIKTAAAVE